MSQCEIVGCHRPAEYLLKRKCSERPNNRTTTCVCKEHVSNARNVINVRKRINWAVEVGQGEGKDV